MGFKKGQSGNPNGRPKKSEADDLRKAIKTVENRKGVKKFVIHCVERAYLEDKMAIAVLNKLVPNLKHVDKDVKSQVSGELKLSWKSK